MRTSEPEILRVVTGAGGPAVSPESLVPRLGGAGSAKRGNVAGFWSRTIEEPSSLSGPWISKVRPRLSGSGPHFPKTGPQIPSS